MWLLLAFLAVPIIEIGLFIKIGGWIGFWPTIAIVIATAFLGTFLVRTQGALALAQLRQSLNELRDPTEPIAHGAMILLAGALLLTPGFFTDTVGFLLLLPPVRLAVMRYLATRIKIQRFTVGQPGTPPRDPRRGPRRGDVIDGDYVEVNPEPPTDQPPSGWTRH